jgi:DNA-binding NarL/FixJ family response regulator
MKPRVLLVEAQGTSADLATRLGSSTHIDFIGHAEGAEEAMRTLEETGPDVLLLDIHRWHGSAVEFCRQVHRVAPIPLVVLASSMTPERWRTLREAGASELLLKHVDTEHLGRELARLATFRATATKENSDD